MMKSDSIRMYEEKLGKAYRDHEPVGFAEYARILMPIVGRKRLEAIVEEYRPRSEGYPRRYC